MVTSEREWKQWAREQAQAWKLQGKLESERRTLHENGEHLPAPEAIRRHCLACKGYRAKHVRRCDTRGCWLHPWRTGDAGHQCEPRHHQDCAAKRRDEDSIPKGRYVAVLCESDMIPNRTGGHYLELVFRISEGECAGRTLRRKLFLDCGSFRQRSTARSELQTICRCTSIMTPNDSSELHDIPLLIWVEQKQERGGRIRSVIEGYDRHEPKRNNKTTKGATAE